MLENAESRRSGGEGILRIVLAILVFGSIWGFLEATLGGFLNLIIFPNKGAIMAGIGVAVMSSALAIYKKPAMLPGIGVVAASFKLLNVWFLFVPISTIHIINPAMAIIFESLAFAVAAAFVLDRIAKQSTVGIGVGFLAGLISAVAYVYFAIYATNSPLFQRLGVSSIGEFIMGSGVIQAAFFGIFTPVGYQIGEKLATVTSPLLSSRRLYYATSAAVICLCWGIGAVAIAAAGL